MAIDQSPEAKPSGCVHFTLARGVTAEIEFCATCGIFHLNIDSVSLRFRPTALRDLRDTLSVALGHYERAVSAQPDRQEAVARRDELH